MIRQATQPLTAYYFVLPSSFDVQEFLTTNRLLLRADDARWLMSTIVRKTANRDTDPWGCVRLHSRILRRIMYEPTMVDIVRALERGGAIETAPYCEGVRSKGYRLAKRYLGDRCIRMPATDPRLLDRIERAQQRQDAEEPEEQRARWKPVHYRLNAEQHHLTIGNEADVILAALPEHTRLCQDVLVSNIRRQDFPFSVSTTGRVFNAITGLKRELREALRFGGEPLGSIDIRCAQPGLLALALSRFPPTNVLNKLGTYKHALPVLPPFPCSLLPPSLSPDLASFVALAAFGLLYERLVMLTGLDRDSVKLAFLRDVLAKRGRYPSSVEQAFRRAFPTVYSWIRMVNCRDHAELIRLLQRLESWLVIERVSPRLLGRVPCITLHDAIFSTCQSLPTIEQAFGETFDEIGFRLSLKREGAAEDRRRETYGFVAEDTYL